MAETDWLRAEVTSDGVQVDRQNNVIHGYVMAQEGVFKDRRGEFDHKSLRQIVRLSKAAPSGLKVRFGHPTLSDDGLGKFLGRAKNPRLDHVLVERDGEKVQLEAVRADLHLDPSSFETPAGNLGEYVMQRAASDPESFSSSLVLKKTDEQRLDSKGRPKLDDEGNELPALWRPIELHASDVVDTGDAVDGFLSAEGLPDHVVREATHLLDEQFSGRDREEVKRRCEAYLQRYLNWRFGAEEPPAGIPELGAPSPGDDDGAYQPADGRVRRLSATVDVFCRLLQAGDVHVDTEGALPADVKPVSCRYDAERRAFDILLHSEAFAPVAEGAAIPSINGPTLQKAEPETEQPYDPLADPVRRRIEWHQKVRSTWGA